ncbi:hypothetical protein V8C40DRAFT_281209 [Trichoderma camerunense]
MASLSTDSQYLHRKKQTFRVRGVPHDWSRDGLASFLAEHGYASPSVQSLATEIHGRSQTATVTFQAVPSQLQERLADPAKGIALYMPSSDQHSRPRSLMLDTAFLGVTTLYSPLSQDHKVDLIAISGLGGHPFGSFKERHGEHMWLRDALPYDTTEEGGDNRPVSRVMVYGYSSSLFQSDSFQNLEDLGTAFHRHLRKLAIAGSFKPIVFIAHSLGGLVLKQTLISLYKSKDKEDQKLLRAVYGIAFFGVPHDGMDISSLIPMVENGPNRFLLESIGLFSSQILSVQHREFLETLGAQESKIICFYETRMSPTAVKQDERGNWKIAGPAAVLVSKSSATHCREWENGPQFICAIDRTHSEMVKFRSEDDEYEKVVELIQSLAREARQTRQCRDPIPQISPEQILPKRIPPGQIQKCLQSLAFESMQTRASDINDAAYMNWIASDHGLLWIKGKPGSGNDLFLCFFFHGRGVELQKTPFDLEKWKWHSNDLWRFLELSLPRLLICGEVHAKDLVRNCRHYPILSSPADISTYLVVKLVVDLGLNVHSIPETSLKLIKWICFARQPLSNAEDYIPDDNRMKKQIVKLSRGLAEFTTGHHFFLDKGFISLNAICIQYFAMEEVVRLASDKEKKVPRANFPFLRYATFSMVEHLKKSDGFDTASERVLELFEQSSDPLNTWTEIHYEIDSSIQVYSADSPVRDSGLAHLAAKHNIQGIMNVVVQSDSITTFGVDSKDSYGMTPLAWAARYGHEDMCKLLLATDQAEIDWKDIFGRSALSLAAEKGHEAVVKRLLDTGQVEINGKDIFSRSALLFAAENGHEAVVKLLLATGQTEINWKDINGWTALLSAAKNGHEAVVKLLLATGQAEIDWKDLFGRSALSLATENGHEAAEIDWKDLFGQSALSLATDRGYEAIVKLLLTTEGWKLPSWAVKKGHKAIIDLLVQYSISRS